MKKLSITLGLLLNLLTFGTQKKIYCDNVYGQNVGTLSRGFVSSNLINIQETSLRPCLRRSDELSDELQQEAQYFNYKINLKNINFTYCEWHLNISIDLSKSMIGKKYKIGYHIFITNAEREDNLGTSLKNFILEYTYQPDEKEKESILFKKLIFSLPIEEINNFLKQEEEKLAKIQLSSPIMCQLILIPYIINQPECKGRICTECKSQYAVDEENDEIPYLSFE